jgi:hypothetical protein
LSKKRAEIFDNTLQIPCKNANRYETLICTRLLLFPRLHAREPRFLKRFRKNARNTAEQRRLHTTVDAPEQHHHVKSFDTGNKRLMTATLKISAKINFIGDTLCMMTVLISCPTALHKANADEIIPAEARVIPLEVTISRIQAL